MRRKAVVLLLVAALLLCVVPASASDVPSDGYIPEREVRLSNGHGSYMPDDQCKWYSNTVCVLGLPLRELDPELTDRWYQIVPVDVSADAVYIYLNSREFQALPLEFFQKIFQDLTSLGFRLE